MQRAAWSMGDTLRWLRREKGWSQQDLAEKADVGLRTVIRLESDAPGNYTMASLASIAQAFGWTESQLLNWSPSPPKHEAAPPDVKGEPRDREAHDTEEEWLLGAWRRLKEDARAAVKRSVKLELGEKQGDAHPPLKRGGGRPVF